LRDGLQREVFDLAFYLVGPSRMTQLNETFLRHAGSTDVITFDYADPAPPPLLHGEIFVCVDEAKRQARKFRTTWQCELVRYVIHGTLHLAGYDDLRPAAKRVMKREEDRLVRYAGDAFALTKLGGAGRPRSPGGA
jgi:probable rRNA maturation factor